MCKLAQPLGLGVVRVRGLKNRGLTGYAARRRWASARFLAALAFFSAARSSRRSRRRWRWRYSVSSCRRTRGSYASGCSSSAVWRQTSGHSASIFRSTLAMTKLSWLSSRAFCFAALSVVSLFVVSVVFGDRMPSALGGVVRGVASAPGLKNRGLIVQTSRNANALQLGENLSCSGSCRNSCSSEVKRCRQLSSSRASRFGKRHAGLACSAR